jgi:hypothetical protein
MTEEKSTKFLRRVIQINESNQIINKFNSIKEASEKTGISHISSVCRGKQKTAGGYIWKYIEEKEIKEISHKTKYLSKDYEKLHTKLINKWNDDFINNKIKIEQVERWLCSHNENFEKKKRIFDFIDNKINCSEICLVCNIRKPITPLYFMLGENFNVDCISGHEDFKNKPATGCRECNKNIHKQKRQQCSKTFINALLKHYPKLDLEWYNIHKNVCCISNIQLVERSNSDWRVSIQNNDTKTDHLPENCIKIAYEFNVAEWNFIKKDLVSTYIDEIFPSFIKELLSPTDTSDLIKYIIDWYNKSPFENGVTVASRSINYEKYLSRYHLKYILKIQTTRYIHYDKNTKNNLRLGTEESKITKEILFDKLIKQKMKCFYTGIPFSTDRDTWNFWSLERLDNNKNHTDENTVFICRIFNSSAGLNRKKLLYALLTQIHVPLPNDVKMKIEKELKS